jgi:phosphotransferase system IIB component
VHCLTRLRVEINLFHKLIKVNIHNLNVKHQFFSFQEKKELKT